MIVCKIVKNLEARVPIGEKKTQNDLKTISGPCMEDRFDLFYRKVLDVPLWPHELEL